VVLSAVVMAEQTLSEETGGRRSRRGVVCRGTMELKESEEAFTRCQPIDKGWTWRLWNLPRPGESVASSSEGACGNKVVSRRLAKALVVTSGEQTISKSWEWLGLRCETKRVYERECVVDGMVCSETR
jgi:hypothetical protein